MFILTLSYDMSWGNVPYVTDIKHAELITEWLRSDQEMKIATKKLMGFFSF